MRADSGEGGGGLGDAWAVEELHVMARAIETPFFWFFVAFALAGITLAGPDDWGTRGIMLLNTMIASANFGAKCVRSALQ
jgi:hypothetical protein